MMKFRGEATQIFAGSGNYDVAGKFLQGNNKIYNLGAHGSL